MIARRRVMQSGADLVGALMLGGCAPVLSAQAPGTPQRQRLWQVGPKHAITTIEACAILARPGDQIEVDAGNYYSDVAVWKHDGVSIRAVSGRVRLLAQGAAAEGKAIWVIRANAMVVQGFDFEGAAVPSRNGAGIKLERGSLLVRNCRFLRNEMGLLTGNDPATVLEVENCEFAYNHRPDGHNHNLYAGHIARLSVTGSYFHHAHLGHLLKSRAALSQIFYNRLTDEDGGTASYELEFPNAGMAVVVGNLVAQSAQTENPCLISYGAEGYAWPRNGIYLVNNTLVNPLPLRGVFLRVAPGTTEVLAVNNLLVGAGTFVQADAGVYSNNFWANPQEFVQATAFDFQLKRRSHLINQATDPGSLNGTNLRPTQEYVHTCTTRPFPGYPQHPGMMQSVGV